MKARVVDDRFQLFPGALAAGSGYWVVSARWGSMDVSIVSLLAVADWRWSASKLRRSTDWEMEQSKFDIATVGLLRLYVWMVSMVVREQ